MSSTDLARLTGVSASRAHQLVTGTLIAQATTQALALNQLEICPWALREGVILRRLDQTDLTGETVATTATTAIQMELTQEPDRNAGLAGQHETRWK